MSKRDVPKPRSPHLSSASESRSSLKPESPSLSSFRLGFNRIYLFSSSQPSPPLTWSLVFRYLTVTMTATLTIAYLESPRGGKRWGHCTQRHELLRIPKNATFFLLFSTSSSFLKTRSYYVHSPGWPRFSMETRLALNTACLWLLTAGIKSACHDT